MARKCSLDVGLVLLAVAAACGGSGGGPGAAPPSSPGGPNPGGSSGNPPGNSLATTVDLGPAALISAGMVVANAAFVTITVCSPGSTTACQTIDHVQVDTGSTGLRILHEVLPSTVVPVPVVDPGSGHAVSECGVFADGWTWGSLGMVDVSLGGRPLKSLVVQVIGDPASGTAPSACSSGNGPEEDTVASFGANALLGVGYYLQDCGTYCADQVPSSGAPFYACSAGGGDQGCTAIALATSSQPGNPVAQLSADNNGLTVQFPATGTAPAASLEGTLLFGVGTQADNDPGSAVFHLLDANGNLNTAYQGQNLDQSVIDSGSSGYYFADSSITACPASDEGNGYYCPPTPISAQAVISGTEGLGAGVNFTVGNADMLFASDPDAAVLPTLAGPLGSLQLSSRTFDWGLPFFYGRSVFFVFEGRVAGSTPGPAVGF